MALFKLNHSLYLSGISPLENGGVAGTAQIINQPCCNGCICKHEPGYLVPVPSIRSEAQDQRGEEDARVTASQSDPRDWAFPNLETKLKNAQSNDGTVKENHDLGPISSRALPPIPDEGVGRERDKAPDIPEKTGIKRSTTLQSQQVSLPTPVRPSRGIKEKTTETGYFLANSLRMSLRKLVRATKDFVEEEKPLEMTTFKSSDHLQVDAPYIHNDLKPGSTEPSGSIEGA